IHNTLSKLDDLKNLIIQKNSQALIEVDGGVDLETGKLLVDAGADVLVAGSFVFSTENPEERIRQLKML
ncbi:MAG: ribulose-phosphate 3-epimerase, partial [Dysgonamonadaceae bacterium]